IAGSFGLTVIDRLDSLPIYLLRISDGAAPPLKASLLNHSLLGGLLYTEPNYIGQAPESVQQPSWADGGGIGTEQEPWAIGQMRLPEAHTISTGAGVVVAVLDTGVDRTHPLLAERLVQGFDFVGLDLDPSEEGM